jgi:hypothetical protein
MAELLIKAVDAPVADSGGKWYAAQIVVVMEDGHEWGGKEGPPDFYILKIPGISKADAQDYISEWRHNVTFAIVNSQPSIDGFRLKLTSDAVSLSGKGTIVKAQVQAFFDKWNCTIKSNASNSVTFDVAIKDALCSEGFWGFNTSGIVFSETQYNSTTGSHLIEVVTPSITDAQIQQKCAINGVAYVAPRSFLATRQEARDAFQADIADKFREIMVSRRRWYVSSIGMNQLAAAGGILTVTPAQAVANLVDGYSV